MNKNALAQKNHSVEMLYSGPLPPSSELQKYEQLSPGAARAIIQNFLAESEHRREIERLDQSMDAGFVGETTKNHAKGLYFAVISVMLTLAVGTVFMLNGYPVEGASIICSVIVGIAACFIYGSRGIKKITPPDHEK